MPVAQSAIAPARFLHSGFDHQRDAASDETVAAATKGGATKARAAVEATHLAFESGVWVHAPRPRATVPIAFAHRPGTWAEAVAGPTALHHPSPAAGTGNWDEAGFGRLHGDPAA